MHQLLKRHQTKYQLDVTEKEIWSGLSLVVERLLEYC
jgi:hypothetical protein